MGKQPYKLGQEAPPPPPYLHTQMVCGGFSKLNATLEVALKNNYTPKNDLYLCFGANEEIYGDSQIKIVEKIS